MQPEDRMRPSVNGIFSVIQYNIQSWPTKHNIATLLANNPYPTAFPYGNGMVLHQQQESSTTKTVHKVINKGLKTYV